MARNTPTETETAVRSYLLFLQSPEQLVDPAEIERCQQAVADAKDPIEKLKALSSLERARSVDGKSLEAGFVQHAREWADIEGVTISAFQSMGVSGDVLSSAGFDTGAPRGRAAAGSRRSRSGGAPRTRAKAVNAETIRDHVLNISGTFTLAQLMEQAGGSPATVKKAIQELIEAGRVENLGADPGHSGKGRAPYRYQTIGA